LRCGGVALNAKQTTKAATKTALIVVKRRVEKLFLIRKI
jgi:hypothetical protein